MPEDNKDVEFGIVEDSSELNTCINLYMIPFRDAYRVFKGTYNSGETSEPIGGASLNQSLVRSTDLIPEPKI